MAIIFDEKNRTLTLHTDRTTYQMQADKYDNLLHLYYGRRTDGCLDYILDFADRGMSGSPYDADTDRTYSLDALPQEFPVQGMGDYRSPMLVVTDKNGAFGCDLRYKSHEIISGKYSLEGLPAVYADAKDDRAETLKIVMKDERLGLEVDLLYGVLPALDIITRSAIVTNKGSGNLTIHKLQTACLDFVGGKYDYITFCGRHAMERLPERQHVKRGSHIIGSRRGASSHQYNPFVILTDSDTTETAGRCWSMQFVYSGGFRAEAERDQYGQTRLQLGLSEEQFAYTLGSGDSIIAPEVIMTYSGSGLGTLSHAHHRCIKEHIIRGKYKECAGPVLINSWEAAYFDFTGETILALADEAAELGIDMLVMDDGWFGIRNDDLGGLGDWDANESKLGCTLAELIDGVNKRGVKFGIWMEPEMVSEDSKLYKEHPDWALVIPDKKPVRGRYQLVLDLARKDVRDWMFDTICGVLDQGNIEYLKWDYNRSIADVYSYKEDHQGRVMYDYMTGLYDVLERLNQRYPDLLIEGCSGGGGRFDAGMLYYTPQIWCSDNTDAIDRLQIQYGTSFGYPVCTVGAHVSACPNHQTGRTVPFETRGVVAMSGTFGYELDPKKLTEDEKKAIRQQIKRFREDSDLIRNGQYHRLTDPSKELFAAWSFVSEDASKAIVNAVLQTKHGNMTNMYMKLRGLKQGAFYEVTCTCGDSKTVVLPADALMETGIMIPRELGEYDSAVWHLTVVE